MFQYIEEGRKTGEKEEEETEQIQVNDGEDYVVDKSSWNSNEYNRHSTPSSTPLN